MTASNRLAATSLDGVIHIKGILFESSNFFGISEALGSTFQAVDLSGLVKASWNGLLKFNRLMADKSDKTGSRIVLANVPQTIYSYLRMLPDFEKHFQIREAELPLVQAGQVKPTVINAGELSGLFQKDREGAFFEISDGNYISGRRDFFPGFFEMSPSPRNYMGLADFMLDYSSYCATIFAISADLAEGLGDTIKRSHSELASILEKSRTGFKVTGLLESDPMWEELNTLSAGFVAQVDGHAARIVSVASDIRVGMEAFSVKFQNSVQTFEDPTPESLQAFAMNTMTAKTITAVAEDLGVTAGSLFAFTAITENAKKFLAQLEAADLTADQIQSLIDAFEIVDPMADEKDFLLPNIEEVFQNAEKEILGLSTASQGCDLIRQIMEHRIREAEVISGFVAAFGTDANTPENAAMLINDVINTIKKKLVTDQEKYALAFYISAPEDAPKPASAQPGDMLMF